MAKHTHEQLDEGQAAYFAWCKLNKARANRRRHKRNEWLIRHGRERHTVTAAEIALL